MKRSRYSEEQIIGILREHEAGTKTAELCRKHGIRPSGDATRPNSQSQPDAVPGYEVSSAQAGSADAPKFLHLLAGPTMIGQ